MRAWWENLWKFKKYSEYEWFRFQVILLLLLVVLYVLSHLIVDNHFENGSNYEIAVLNSDQDRYLDEIIESNKLAKEDSIRIDSTIVDLKKTSCILKVEKLDEIIKNKYFINVGHKQVTNRMISYLSSEFNNKWEKTQKDSIRAFLKKTPIREAKMFLQKTRFKIESNFWLIGPAVYVEIVFWALFGVICSILFNLSIISKNATTDLSNLESTTFDSSEIPSQVAKLLYAPMCTIIVVLGYNFFTDQMVDIKSSKGVIVFAFVAGFYSSRLIALLDRMKEVVLPGNSNALLGENKDPLANFIKDITIKLELSNTIAKPEFDEITKIGLGKAIVTIDSKETSDKPALDRETDDNSGVFKFKPFRPGNYIIKAVWKDTISGKVLTLTAQQQKEFKNSGEVVTLSLK